MEGRISCHQTLSLYVVCCSSSLPTLLHVQVVLLTLLLIPPHFLTVSSTLPLLIPPLKKKKEFQQYLTQKRTVLHLSMWSMKNEGVNRNCRGNNSFRMGLFSTKVSQISNRCTHHIPLLDPIIADPSFCCSVETVKIAVPSHFSHIYMPARNPIDCF